MNHIEQQFIIIIDCLSQSVFDCAFAIKRHHNSSVQWFGYKYIIYKYIIYNHNSSVNWFRTKCWAIFDEPIFSKYCHWPLYVTSNYSTWIFCRRVSGFATECPCGIWCRGLITCLLHVGPPFVNRFLNTSWAVDLTYWILYLHFFFVFWHMQLYMSWYIISFLVLSLLPKCSLFFKVLVYYHLP